MWEVALIQLIATLVQAGEKADAEGKAADLATEITNLNAEWSRKTKDDADFDKEFGVAGTPTADPPVLPI